jgi:hypothetical protein
LTISFQAQYGISTVSEKTMAKFKLIQGPRFLRNRFPAYYSNTPAYRPKEEPHVASLENTEHPVDEVQMRSILQAYNQHVEEQRQLSNQETENTGPVMEEVLQSDMLAHHSIEANQTDGANDKDQAAEEYKPFTAETSDVSQAYDTANDIPYPTQSAPTQVLYERARIAATAKASPNSRRAGLPSHRRPWATEEENALMAGLDRVKGPHWSQILAMFGAGGTINESLKDRNQVQLKDKARNLKLFFLKSGIEVPYYLQFVTGELKTRAPAQAAKNAAKERQRQHGDEDKAHVEGILALVGGGTGAGEGAEGTEGEEVEYAEGEEVEEDAEMDRREDEYDSQLVAQLQAAQALSQEGSLQSAAIAVGQVGGGG